MKIIYNIKVHGRACQHCDAYHAYNYKTMYTRVKPLINTEKYINSY